MHVSSCTEWWRCEFLLPLPGTINAAAVENFRIFCVFNYLLSLLPQMSIWNCTLNTGIWCRSSYPHPPPSFKSSNTTGDVQIVRGNKNFSFCFQMQWKQIIWEKRLIRNDFTYVLVAHLTSSAAGSTRLGLNFHTDRDKNQHKSHKIC